MFFKFLLKILIFFLNFLFSLNYYGCSCTCNCYKDNDNSNNNNNNDNNKKFLNKNNENDNDNNNKNNKDNNKNNNNDKDDFILLNCGFTQIYEENGKEVDYVCCWLISAILTVLNIPKYQKFIKNYQYDGDEKNLHLKIIKDIYEELKNNIGKYDLDFRKYYYQLVDHGVKYYKEIFTKNNNRKFFFSSLIDPTTLIHIIISNKTEYDYFKINEVLNLYFFVNQNPSLNMYKLNINNYKNKYNLIKENIDKRIKYYPGHFAFYKVFNNFNQDFFKWDIFYDKEIEYSCLNIHKDFDKKFDQYYLFIFEDKKTKDEFNNLKKQFQNTSKINNIKENNDIFENIKNSNKNLDELKKNLENYNYKLNCIIFGPGHYTTVIKDPKSNNFYSLDSYNTLGHKNGELKNFYNTFPEKLTLGSYSAMLYIFTVTKKDK